LTIIVISVQAGLVYHILTEEGEMLTLNYRISDICYPAVECHLCAWFKVLAGDREKDAETAGNYHPSKFEKNMISRQAVCHPGFDSVFSRNILL